MGGGTHYDPTVYSSTVGARKAAGGDDAVFAHSSATLSSPRSTWKVDPALDPAWVAGDGSPLAGKAVRESRDSDAFPESEAVFVAFDVTGSMASLPKVFVEKLPMLNGMLRRRGILEQPQLLFAAFGDAYVDLLPLQIGQFEADNAQDDQLTAFVLEGGGGGTMEESSELILYFAGFHSALDCVEKRGKKGYLVLVTDEMAYPFVRKQQVEELVRQTGLQDNLPLAAVLARAQELYEVAVIVPQHHSYGETGTRRVEDFWKELLPERVFHLDDPAAVCEAVALFIGITEGVFATADDGLDALVTDGADRTRAASASKALSAYAGRGGALATVEGDGLDLEGDDGATAV